MNTLIHADIFFFVSTVCVALIAVFLVIALIYLLKILGNIYRLSTKANIEGTFFFDQLREVAERMKARRAGLWTIIRFFRRFLSRYA